MSKPTLEALAYESADLSAESLSAAVASGKPLDVPIHALRVGKVRSRYTGRDRVDITDEMCAAVVDAFSALRVPVPCDFGHALEAQGDAAEVRTYGVVKGLRHEPGDGVYADVRLSADGVKLAASNPGTLYVSPVLAGPVYDPAGDEGDAPRWPMHMRSLSFTFSPEQDGLQPVIPLSATAPANIYRLEMASDVASRISEAIKARHPDYDGWLVDYDPDAGFAIVGMSHDGYVRNYRTAYTDDGERVELTGPREPVREVHSVRYEPLSAHPNPSQVNPPAPRSANQEESAMAEQKAQVIVTLGADEGAGALTRYLGDGDAVTIDKASVERLAAERADAEQRIASLTAEVSKAKGEAEASNVALGALSARVDELQAGIAARAKVEAEAAIASLKAETVERGAVKAADFDAVWLPLIEKSGIEAARAALSAIPNDAAVPLSRPVEGNPGHGKGAVVNLSSLDAAAQTQVGLVMRKARMAGKDPNEARDAYLASLGGQSVDTDDTKEVAR